MPPLFGQSSDNLTMSSFQSSSSVSSDSNDEFSSRHFRMIHSRKHLDPTHIQRLPSGWKFFILFNKFKKPASLRSLGKESSDQIGNQALLGMNNVAYPESGFETFQGSIEFFRTNTLRLVFLRIKQFFWPPANISSIKL